MLRNFFGFVRDSRAEMGRVTWPTREATLGGTAVVIFVSLLLVIFMWIMDLLITRALSLVLR